MFNNINFKEQNSQNDIAMGSIVSIWVKVGEFLRLVLRTPTGRVGLPIVLLHAVIAIFGSWLAPYPDTLFHLDDEGNIRQLLAPSWRFILGTDQFGRDILSRVMSGSTSLVAVAGSGTILGIIGGSAIGMISGYAGKWTDEIVMRVMDGLMSFPSLLMALLVISTLGPNAIFIVSTVAIVTIPGVARVMRSATLSLKEQEFVQSARLRGEGTLYIIFREIFPNTLSIIAVELSVRLSYSILIVASLGFLGLGVQPPSPDWGLMISQSRQFLGSSPWVALAPAGAVASLVVGINLLTDGIKQAKGLPREEMP